MPFFCLATTTSPTPVAPTINISTHPVCTRNVSYNLEAYDTECAALTELLETAAKRATTPGPERVTIFTDAQAAIQRIASEEPSRGQMYAIQDKKYIATLQRTRPARPDITIEIQ
jgi:ribonuclease HI